MSHVALASRVSLAVLAVCCGCESRSATSPRATPKDFGKVTAYDIDPLREASDAAAKAGATVYVLEDSEVAFLQGLEHRSGTPFAKMRLAGEAKLKDGTSRNLMIGFARRLNVTIEGEDGYWEGPTDGKSIVDNIVIKHFMPVRRSRLSSPQTAPARSPDAESKANTTQ